MRKYIEAYIEEHKILPCFSKVSSVDFAHRLLGDDLHKYFKAEKQIITIHKTDSSSVRKNKKAFIDNKIIWYKYTLNEGLTTYDLPNVIIEYCIRELTSNQNYQMCLIAYNEEKRLYEGVRLLGGKYNSIHNRLKESLTEISTHVTKINEYQSTIAKLEERTEESINKIKYLEESLNKTKKEHDAKLDDLEARVNRL
jgi:hypothetical protein